LVLRIELNGAETGLDGFRVVPAFHERHAEAMPAVKKIRVDFHAAPEFFDRCIEFPDSDVAGRLVENLRGGL
jgi:hypothetical protein